MVQYSADTSRSTAKSAVLRGAAGVFRLRVLLAVLLVTIATMAMAPAVYAQCPSGVNTSTPTNNATGVATQGRLTWAVTPSVSVDTYTVTFYEGAGCGTTPVGTATVLGSFNYLDYFDLAPSATYSWKVEAVKNGCATVVSSCATFTTSACHSNGPTLINPPNGATDDHLKVVFAWDPILGNPTGYEVFVQVGSVGAFQSFGTTGANVFELTRDIPAGMHKWYVQGILPGGCTPARSDTWSFGTSCPIGQPNLVSPSAGQALSSPTGVTFQWSSVSGADGYDVFYTRSGGAEVKAGETREGTNLAGTSLTVTLPGTGSYSWRVVALSSGCGSLSSAAGSFTVTDACPTTGVSLIAPAAGATNISSPVSFSWNAQPNAATAGLTGYKVYLAISGAEASVIAETNVTTASFNVPAGTHSWFVESQFATCPAVRSSTSTFTITAPPECPTTGPTLTAPANDATVASPVSFSWTAVARASYYELKVLSLAGLQRFITTSTSLNNRVFPEGSYNWSVTPNIPGCRGVESFGAFTVGGAATCPTAAAAMTLPAAGATVVRSSDDPLVEFTWAPVTGATFYDLVVSHSNGQTYRVADLTEGFHNKLDLPNGTMQWSVVTRYGGGCADVNSTPRTLTIQAPPPCILSTPALMGPNNNADTLSPIVVFNWSPVPNATEYRIYRRNGPNADNRELLGTTGQTSLTKTFDMDEFVFDTTNTAPLEWYVEARGAARCTASQSGPRIVRFKKAQVCPTTAPVLQSPAAATSTTNRDVQFTWQSVSGVVGYKIWYSFNGSAPTALTENALAADITAATYRMPLGSSEWWVEALFPGCPSRESVRRLLNITAPCSVPAPTIMGPDPTAGTVTPPVTLSWTRVANATYDVFVQTANSPSQPIATVTPAAGSTGNITFVYSAQPGAVTWKVRANVPNCGTAMSAESNFTVVATPPCTTPDKPTLSTQRTATSNKDYTVKWNQVANALTYEVQESTSSSFAVALTTTTTVTGTQTTFSHDVAVDTSYYYRVRAKSSCNTTLGEYSGTSEIVVEAEKSDSADSKIPVGSQSPIVTQVFFANPFNAVTAFTARGDKPWVKVAPASGLMPATGITFTMIVDPKDLAGGTNSSSVIVEFTTPGAGNVGSHATTTYTVPVNITLVTPVTTKGKTEPPSDAIIIPAVAAADGANASQWRSDIRVTNSSGEAGRYQVTFTPSRQDGSRASNQTNIDIPAGTSMALDGVLRNWFGARPTENVTGVIEVRSLKTGATTSARRGRQLLGSSRTYNQTASGTYGQFIPAIPVSDFVGKGQVLTLSEVNQSASARTNLGLVEGSGQGANVRVTVFDANGTQLTTFDQYLRAGEHVQMNNFLGTRGITAENARVNVEVLTDTGRVMSYASVIDNQTNDPLLVEGQVPTSDVAWAIAGVADLDTGAARWRTDVRIYNPGATAVNASLVFYPTGNPANSKTITTSIPARSTRELKDILRNSFALTATGGAVHVTTATATPLLVTARTYNLTTTGTYGQYIPGVPRSEGVGLADPSLQVQQLEGSAAYRTNFGLAEVSGQPIKVELIAVIPGSVVTPRATVELRANEFKQLVNIFASTFGLTTDVFNARIAVRVVEGTGKVIAYGSVIDQKTQDPTYVPAER